MKHALVTGAGSGIGAATATRLAADGYRLSLLGRRLEALEQTAAACGPAAQARAIGCDVTQEAAVAEAFRAAVAGFGPIDVLVNGAGGTASAPFHKLQAADWRAVLALNLDGAFHCCARVVGPMRARRAGRIINIASTAALKGYPYVSAYCAAKHGLLGLTRALAHELAPYGVTVNAVCPGFADTALVRDSIANIVAKTGRSEEQALAELVRNNPQARLIEPREVADTVSWLCSDAARSVNGQAIALCGGETP